LEILSTGEKIRRARIYKGYTLKDICDDKISISKMSCIENDKVDAEDWIIEHVSKKLELDIDYLKQSITEQLTQNLNLLEKSKGNEDFEEKA
jgi:transcriptional regulator with XRE-family HTH domain